MIGHALLNLDNQIALLACMPQVESEAITQLTEISLQGQSECSEKLLADLNLIAIALLRQKQLSMSGKIFFTGL